MNSDKPAINRSKCCGAPAIVDGDDKEGTHYFVCTDCWKPCDIEHDKENNSA